MMNKASQKNEADMIDDDREAARAALQQMEPETLLGKKLIELALRGIEEGVSSLNEEEMAAYLGRNRYADVS